MDAQRTVWVAFRMRFLGEFVLSKGFCIVLLRVRHDGRGIQPDEGRIHHTQLIQLSHQAGHDRFQITVVQLPQKTVIGPVGWQRLHDVEAAIVGDEPVVAQIISQIGDLRKSLALHDDKRADHGFFRKAPPPGRRSGQRKVQTAKELVVEHSGALGCEQRHVLNNFLSVDSGQPLSRGVFLQANYTKKELRFLQYMSDSRFQPWRESVATTILLEFCSWLL